MKIHELTAGQLLELSCPEGEEANHFTGQLLPDGPQPKFYVVAVDGAQVTLGPLEAGRLPLNLKCSGQEESSAHTVLVQPINPKPKVYEPFSPESISLCLLYTSPSPRD